MLSIGKRVANNLSRRRINEIVISRGIAISAAAEKKESHGFALPQIPPFDYTPQPYNGPLLDEILQKRKQYLCPSMFYFYEKPLNIVEGKMQYLFDENGRRYLDAFGGIVTVSCGHCHPDVVDAIVKQTKLLQHTTTIYLHHAIAEFAEALAEKFPGNLKVVFFTNSGTESNELATMMARLYTGNHDMVSVRNSYHGSSSVTMGMTAQSKWKYNVVQSGVHHALNPHPYRGVFGSAAPSNLPSFLPRIIRIRRQDKLLYPHRIQAITSKFSSARIQASLPCFSSSETAASLSFLVFTSMATQQNKPATGYPASGQPSYAMGPGAYNTGYAQPYPAYHPQPPPPGPYNNRFGNGRSMFRRVLALVITLAVITGIAILITWLVLRPHRPKFYIESANVSQLNVNGSRLDSKMDFNITIRNSNKKIGIYYDEIYAKAYYDHRLIGYNQLEEFYQGRKTTKAIVCPLSSNNLLLENHVSSDLSQDLARKSVGMTVKLDAWIRFKVGAWTTRHYTMVVYCDVTVNWNGTSGRLSHPRRCDVDI